MKKQVKNLIALNALIYVSLLFLPPILFYIYKSIKLASQPASPSHNLNIHPAYPTEQDRLYQKAMEKDAENIKTKLLFRSFIGWRRSPYQSEYSNVSGPYKNRHSYRSSPVNSTWFFGGSTMWGTGASDLQTIPSWYAKTKKVDVYNLGETAWTSRQSLNQLINLLGDGYVPKRIIFYDGVNDIIHGCRAELTEVPSHTQEPLIRDRLRPFSELAKSHLSNDFNQVAEFIAAPYKAVAGKLGIYTAAHTPYGSLDCLLAPSKAQSVANHLVNNWYSAYLIANAYNAEFLAILQPHSFVTKGVDLNYLNSSEEYLRGEHDAVYPLIRKALNAKCDSHPEFCDKFVDGSAWLDHKQPVYIDFAHITGSGNKIIAQKIIANE